MNIVFLGIGTNLGDRENNLKDSISAIEEHIGSIVKTSSVYETEPWGFEAQNDFLNMVVKVETKLNPSGVLGAILMIETLLGRRRGEKQYVSRLIDIDIILFGDHVLDEMSLKIPHPRLQERKFVLLPLCEIEPQLVHPVLKRSIVSLLESCPDNSRIKIFR
jgi:2-amino-4-hydroxy-6-hydroxymethyldihydropteridine diphosphokinase